MEETMKRLTSLLLLFAVVIMTLAPFSALTVTAADTSDGTALSSVLFEGSDEYGYHPSSDRKVTTASTGHSRLGELRVHGSSYRVTTYHGYQAVAVSGGDISFTFSQALGNSSHNGKEWFVSEDSYTTVAGRSTGTVGNGALIILKSYDGSHWQHEGVPAVGINNTTQSFSPKGEDVAKGVYYRFLNAVEYGHSYTYQSGTKTVKPSYWDAPWYIHAISWAAVLIWVEANSYEVPVYSTGYEYTNLLSESTVYVASDAAVVGFRSKDTDTFDLTSLNAEDVTPEKLTVLSKGITLRDGDTSCSYIRLDKLGNTCNKVTCSYNGAPPFTVNDGQILTEAGRYDFTVTSPFGTRRETTLYILDPTNAAYDYYFGNGLMDQSTRMYDPNCPVPLYGTGTAYTILGDANRPGVFGRVLRYADEAAVASETYTVVHTFDDLHQTHRATLDKSGYYCFDLYSGNPETSGGQLIHWVFVLAVADSEGYGPTVNYSLLHSAFRSSSYERSVINVVFPTAGGGNYVFVFPQDQEDEALAFSESIEKRFVETFTDADGNPYYYYKAAGSVNGSKRRYDDLLELWEALDANSRSNCSKGYIIGSEEYASMTVDQIVDNIQTTSLTHDVRVVVDDTVREGLLTEEVFLNGFTFASVADYEVSEVILLHEDGYEYSIPFGVDVSTVLERTGYYTVLEKNWAAERHYNAVYIHGNDNTATLTLESTVLSKCKDSPINQSNDGERRTAHAFSLVSAADRLDSQSLLTVVGEGFRETMLLSEIDHYVIDTVGSYELIFENRQGNQFRIYLTVEPLPTLQVRFHDCGLPAVTAVYGRLPDLPTPTREGYEFLHWVDRNGEAVTDRTFATEDDVDLYPRFRELPREALVIMTDSFGGHTVHHTTVGSSFPLPMVTALPGYTVSVTVNGVPFTGQTLTVDSYSMVVSFTYTPISFGETEPVREAETEPVTEADTDAATEPETTPETEPDVELQAQPRSEDERHAKPDTEPETQPDSVPENKTASDGNTPAPTIWVVDPSVPDFEDDTVPEDPRGGCSAVVSASSALLLMMAAAAVVALRKKH